jgi:hypothetical protein
VRLAELVEADVHAPVAPAAQGAEGFDRQGGEFARQGRRDVRRADHRRALVFDAALRPLGVIGHDRRNVGRQLGIVDFGKGQHALLGPAEDADVELAPRQEALHGRRLVVLPQDDAHLAAQGGDRAHHGVARQPDARMLLGGLDDQRETPLHAGHVLHAFQQPRPGRHPQSRALQQAGGHVLVAAEAQGQGVRAGDREAHHAHQRGHAHLVKRAVHDVVVLVEDHVRLQARQLALEPQHVVGQRQHGHTVSEAAQRARQAADETPQISRAAAVVRRLGDGVPAGVVDQGDVQHAFPFHGCILAMRAEGAREMSNFWHLSTSGRKFYALTHSV